MKRSRRLRSQIIFTKFFVLYKKRLKKQNDCSCIFCIIDVQRASYAHGLEKKKHLENVKGDRMIPPDSFLEKPNEFFSKRPRSIYDPKPSKHIAREKT